MNLERLGIAMGGKLGKTDNYKEALVSFSFSLSFSS